MDNMEILYFKDEDTKKLLFQYIQAGSLVPIIGSGFSRGLSANQGTVPSGEDFKNIMCDMIVTSNKEIKKEDIEEMKFSQIAQIFYEVVNTKLIKSMLRDNFTNVKLDDDRRNFLNIDWPYLYTLNIDDAIENNSEFYPILPYHPLEKSILKKIKVVYKMHGDANEEFKYTNSDTIIFNEEQYIISLEKNKEILHNFTGDFTDNNIIFIGCSLDDEIDLMYAIKKIEDLEHSQNCRFYIMDKEPDILQKIKLKKYGINKVLIVENYKEFYKEVYKIVGENKIFGEQQLKEFKNPQIENILCNENETKEYLLWGKNIYANNKFLIPEFFIERNITQIVMNKLLKNNFIALIGRRISGKTFLLADLVKRLKGHEVYYFPSTVTIDEDIINRLLEIKNSTIIFDSNSLDYDTALTIRESLASIKENNTKIIIATNTNDNIMYALLSSNNNNEKFVEIKIDNKFNDEELKKLNVKLSKNGIPEFANNKYSGSDTILDNIVRISEVYNNKSLVRNISLLSDVSKKELKIFVLLAACDKLYRPIIDVLGITNNDIEKIIKDNSPLIENELLKSIEKHYHANSKLVSNSKLWILYMLGRYAEIPGSAEEISETISSVVESLLPFKYYDNIISTLILFDNLNQIFPKKAGGAGKVIFSVYAKLQKSLYNDKNYWLQRAKSILNLKREDEKELNDALIYAKKAYEDSSILNNSKKIKENSSLTIAMIYGRLFSLSKNTNINYFKEAIFWYYTAIIDFSTNKYISVFINRSKKNRSDLKNICEVIVLKNGLVPVEVKSKAQILINEYNASFNDKFEYGKRDIKMKEK